MSKTSTQSPQRGITVSKTNIRDYDNCKYLAWSLQNGKVAPKKGGEEAGFLAVKIAKEVLQSYKGDRSENIRKISAQYPLEVCNEVADMPLVYGELLEQELLYDLEEVEFDKMFSTSYKELPEVSINAKIDVYGEKFIMGDRYKVVGEIKASLYHQKEVGASIFPIMATYIADEERLPILFKRVNVRNKEITEIIFYKDQLENMYQALLGKVVDYYLVMGSQTPPQTRVGKHCLNCPMGRSCPVANQYKDEFNAEQKLDFLQWAKLMQKSVESELKDLAKSQLINEDTNNFIGSKPIINGTDLCVELNRTSAWSLSDRKVSKSKVVKELMTSDIFQKNPYLIDGNVDIKFATPEFRQLLLESGYGLKETLRTSFSIKAVADEVKEDSDE